MKCYEIISNCIWNAMMAMWRAALKSTIAYDIIENANNYFEFYNGLKP